MSLPNYPPPGPAFRDGERLEHGVSEQGQAGPGADLAQRHLQISHRFLADSLVASVRGNDIEGLLLAALAAKHSGIALVFGLQALSQVTGTPALRRQED